MPLASVDPLLRDRVRYDARGNRMDVPVTVAHTDQTRHTTAVVPATVVVYALMSPSGELVGVGRESEIEALYDLIAGEYSEGLEIVPC